MSPGEFVKVARVGNQAEAELVEGILRDANIPALVRRAPGADVPDFLAAGARDVLVPSSMAQEARDALTPAPPEVAATPPPERTGRTDQDDPDR